MDFGAVSIEWGTLLIQLILFLAPLVFALLLIRRVFKRGYQSKIRELEQRIEQLERDRSR